MHLRKVTIEQMLFRMAFDRDVPFHDPYDRSTYLDSDSGDIVWVYDNDEHASWESGIPEKDNQAARERVETDKDRFLYIPGLSHEEHHQIMKEFLDSEWTESESERNNARTSFFESIGGWKKTVQDEYAVSSYYDFRKRKTEQLAEAFLKRNGIISVWR